MEIKSLNKEKREEMKIKEINGIELKIKKLKTQGYLLITKDEEEKYNYKKYINLEEALKEVDKRVRVTEKINNKLNEIKYLEIGDSKLVFKYRGYTCSILRTKNYWGFIYSPLSLDPNIPISVFELDLDPNIPLPTKLEQEYLYFQDIMLKKVRSLQQKGY